MENNYFSDKIRDKIDELKIGTVFNSKDIANSLGVEPENYRSKSRVINSMIQEKVAAKSLVKQCTGVYLKIKTVKKKVTPTAVPKKPKKEKPAKPCLIVYRGVIYPSAESFCSLFCIDIKRLKDKINDNVFCGWLIFRTEVDAIEEAEYYARYYNKQAKI